MKRIVTLIALLFTGLVSNAVAMQKPANDKDQTITYSRLQRTANHLKICAFANGVKIGSIKFKQEENKHWYLAKLSVDKEFRKSDTSNKKIGFTLFSKCLAHICSKNPLRIHWFVTRIKDDSPSIATLVEIYKRMIGKLNLDKKLVTEDYETFTFMALEFNKQSMT